MTRPTAARSRVLGAAAPERRSPNRRVDPGSRRRESALISKESKSAPTHVSGYTVGAFSAQHELSALATGHRPRPTVAFKLPAKTLTAGHVPRIVGGYTVGAFSAQHELSALATGHRPRPT